MSTYASLLPFDIWESMGYVASALVLAAFCMREMIPLRVAALLSNLAFIAYGVALGLAPIWLLHTLLLPVNGWRLVQAIGGRRRPADPALWRRRGARLTGAGVDA
jgi:hypothetical protein